MAHLPIPSQQPLVGNPTYRHATPLTQKPRPFPDVPRPLTSTPRPRNFPRGLVLCRPLALLTRNFSRSLMLGLGRMECLATPNFQKLLGECRRALPSPLEAWGPPLGNSGPRTPISGPSLPWPKQPRPSGLNLGTWGPRRSIPLTPAPRVRRP